MQEARSLNNGASASPVVAKPKRPRKPRATKVTTPVIENLSGFHPTEFNVLILPDEAEDMITTKGGIKFYKPLDTVEKETHAGQRGRLIEVSPLAYTYERWPAGKVPPQPGECVVFAKYSGVRMTSRKDGREYLMMKDKDIICSEDE